MNDDGADDEEAEDALGHAVRAWRLMLHVVMLQSRQYRSRIKNLQLNCLKSPSWFISATSGHRSFRPNGATQPSTRAAQRIVRGGVHRPHRHSELAVGCQNEDVILVDW